MCNRNRDKFRGAAGGLAGVVERLMIDMADFFGQHADGGSREGCVGSDSFPPDACGHCQGQDPRTLPSSSSPSQYSPPLRLDCTWLPIPWQILSPFYWGSHPSVVSLCPANLYSHSSSLSPTGRSGQRAAQFYSWILKEILKPNMSICSDPSLKPCPLRIYVAFLSRHKPKDDSPGIHNHSLCSWSNGLLGEW